MNAWRTALRVARREARRAKGRSALVLAMIALPVLCLAFAAVTYDMFTLTPREQVARDLARADALLRWPYAGPVRQEPTQWEIFSSMGEPGQDAPSEPRQRAATEAELLAVLPPNSRVIPMRSGTIQMRTATGVGGLDARGLDAADPLARGLVSLLSGRAPAGPDEVALTGQAIERLNAPVGGTVRLADGSRQWTVVGVVEFPARLHEIVLFHPAGFPLPEPGSDAPADGRGAVMTDPGDLTTWLADTPGDLTWPDVKRLNQRGLISASRAVLLDPPPASESILVAPPGSENVKALAFGALIAGLGVLEVVLLAGPAFAVGARRRQRDLALVAASGGTPAHLRRIVLADGVVLGVAGAVIGITLGIALAFAGRPLVEEYLAHFRAGGYRVYPLALSAIAGVALLTGLLAALVPAFTAARQDVVAALSGRRPAVRSKKRWLALGLVTTGLGAGVAAYGAWRVSTDVILAGLVLGELGLVVCTPSLVGLIARVGRVLPLAPRIALRDTARNRAAAAPAISAVMAAVAGSVAIGAYLSSSQARQEAGYLPSLPSGYAMVTNNPGPDAPPITASPERLAQAMRASLPVADTARIEAPACPADAKSGTYCGLSAYLPEERRCPLWAAQGEPTAEQKKAAARDERCRNNFDGWSYGGGLGLGVVDDGSTVAMLTGASGADAAAAAATLRAGGVVIKEDRFVVDGRVRLLISRSDRQPTDRPVEEKDLPGVTAPAYVLRTGVLAQGAVIYSPQVVAAAGFRTTFAGVLAATERMPTQAEVDRLNAELRGIEGGLGVSVERGPRVGERPELIVLAIAAGLITLGAAGIATGLAAADGRRDLSTLAAVGASPRVRRLLSLSQSGVIAGLGSLLGVVAGLGAGFAVLYALNQAYAEAWPPPLPYPLVVPWRSLAIVLAVPLVAMLGAGLLTRSRLPVERRLG